MMLPVPIADSAGKGTVKRLIQFRFRRLGGKGERAVFLKLFRVEYLSSRGKTAAVRISDLSK
jgi:hypothetical protein